MLFTIFFIISILAGQLIKFPIFGIFGPTLLDFCIFLLTILGLFNIQFHFKKMPMFIRFGYFFILLSFLSLLITPLQLKTQDYIISISYALRFFIYLTFSWIIYSEGFPSFKKRIPFIFLISGIGLSILGLLQLIFFPSLEALQTLGWDPHYFRTVSTFLDPNFAGAYFVLTIILLTSPNSGLLRRLRLLAMTVVYLALLTTFSRSSYLMFLISGLTLSYLKKSKPMALITIVVFTLLLIGFQIYSIFVATPRNIDRTRSASSRVNTWTQGWEIFKHSTIFGVGFNSYRYAIKQYNLADRSFLESRGSSSNDSSLLHILTTTGIIGFLIYILFLFSLFRRKDKIPLLAGLTGLLVQATFSNSLFYPFILIWILLMAI